MVHKNSTWMYEYVWPEILYLHSSDTYIHRQYTAEVKNSNEKSYLSKVTRFSNSARIIQIIKCGLITSSQIFVSLKFVHQHRDLADFKYTVYSKSNSEHEIVHMLQYKN